MADGIITKQDLITDDALNFGIEYAENVKLVIAANESIKKSAKDIFDIYKNFSGVTSQEDFIESKNKEALAILKVKNAIKIQEQAFKTSENIKLRVVNQNKNLASSQNELFNETKKTSNAQKEQDQLEKNLISTKKKNQLASESTNRALIAERETLRQQNLEIKRSLTTMGQLISKRDQARKSVQNLNAQVALGKPLSDIQQKELRESTLEFTKYDKAVRVIKENTGQFQESVGNYPKLFKSVGASVRQLIPILGIAGAVRSVVGVLGDARRTIADFDEQIVAVQKTTGLADGDIAKLKNEVISLGLATKGITIQGLASSAEIAGQLGVKGTKDILNFSKAVEFLKASAKGITEETVADFAKFIEISDDSAENADRLGSVITNLGNNFATTEKEVISSAIEIQKGVQIYDVSAEAVLGLSAATTSLGVQDAAARTSIAKTFKVLDQSIKTGENLEEVLSLTGLTQEELSKQFTEDATGTFVKFLGGLDNLTKGGGNTIKTLEGLKLSGDRIAPTLLSLASNNDKVAEAVGRANEEYIRNKASVEEAELASKSLNAITADFSDSWDGLILSIENGDGVISGFFKGLISSAADSVKGLILLNETIEDTVSRVGGKAETNGFDFETGFLDTLSREEAEKFAISQLDKTDEQIEKQKEILRILIEQRKQDIEENPLKAGSGLSGPFTVNEGQDFNEAIEKTAVTIGLLEGKLKSYDKILGITGETIEQNTNNLVAANGEIVRNVAFLREQIKLEREKIGAATNRKEAKDIQDKVKALKDELNTILGVETANKRKSKAAQDALNLERQRIQQNIDLEKSIVDNDDLNTGDRLNASLFLYRERLKLISLEKDKALESAKGRKDEEIRLEEKFNSDIKNLVETRDQETEKILASAFEKAKQRIQDKKDLEDRSLSADEDILRNQQIQDIVNLEDLKSTSRSIESKLALEEKFQEDLKQLKLDAAVSNVEAQISQVEKELLVSTLGFEQRKELEMQLVALRESLSQADLDISLENLDRRKEAEQRLLDFKTEKIKEASEVIAESLNLDSENLERLITGFSEGFENALDAVSSAAAVAGDITNSVFDNNLQRIDDQIEASTEYYDTQFALAEGDRDQQDNIRAEQELKRIALEQKRRKEQEKQAKFQKAVAVAQIGFNTAQAILGIWAQVPKFDFGISAGVLTGFVSALGAAQIASVIAKPIPKYAVGTDNHPGGLAEVAEIRPEVIKEPGKSPYIQSKRAILDLPKGTEVIKSVSEFEKMQSNMLHSSFNKQLGGILSYNNINTFENDNSDLIEEMRKTRKVIKDKNSTFILPKNKKIDVPHALFSAKNTNWNI